MIRFEKTAQTAQDKQAEATQWAIEVTNYINANHPGVTLQVFAARFGIMNMIYWTYDVDDLAALDSYQKNIRADEGYQALIGKAQGLLVSSSIADRVIEAIPAS